MSVNCVTLTGNLGADSQLRVTQSKTQVLTFSLGVSDRVPEGDGKWGDHTNWVDCVIFGRRAEALAPYLTKGAKVAVRGRIRTHTYEKDGRHVKRWEVRVDDLDLMQARRERQAAREPGAQRPQGQEAAQDADVYDEDIPF